MQIHAAEITKLLAKCDGHFLDAYDSRRIVSLRSKQLPPWVRTLRKKIENAEKFLVCSEGLRYPEQPEELVETIKSMIEGQLFKLPYPETWVEVYSDDIGLRTNTLFSEVPNGGIRAVSIDFSVTGGITIIQPFWLMPETGKFRYAQPGSPQFTLSRQSKLDLEVLEMLRMHAFSCTLDLQAFMVLNSAINSQRVTRSNSVRIPRLGRSPISTKEKDYRIVTHVYTEMQVPDDDTVPVKPNGKPPRRHLVRGHFRFRERPREEWRWIAPFWRGRGEPIKRDHYEIRTLKEDSQEN
jgi:hypothetical protein